MKGQDWEKIKKEWKEEEEAAIQQVIGKLKEEMRLETKAFSSFHSDIFIQAIFPNFPLKQPLGTWTPYIGGITTLARFYQKIIIPIKPERKMINRLGISILDLVKLFKDGFVLPLILESPDCYTPDELKPLFELRDKFHVPSLTRYWAAYWAACLFRQDKQEENGRNIGEDELKISVDLSGKERSPYNFTFKERNTVTFFLPPGSDGEIDGIYTRRLYDMVELALGKSALGEFQSRIGILDFFGFKEVVRFISEILPRKILPEPVSIFDNKKNIESICRMAADFSSLLCEPLYLSFGGYMNYSYDYIQKLKGRTGYDHFSGDKAIILPSDFLSEFTQSYFIHEPVEINNPVVFFRQVHRLNCLERHFKIIKAINEELDQGNFRTACDKVKEAKEIIEELDAKVCEISRSYKLTTNIIRIGSIFLAAPTIQSASQALSQSDITSMFYWVGDASSKILMNVYSEEISQFLTGLQYGRTSSSYLLWQHKKRGKQ